MGRRTSDTAPAARTPARPHSPAKPPPTLRKKVSKTNKLVPTKPDASILSFFSIEKKTPVKHAKPFNESPIDLTEDSHVSPHHSKDTTPRVAPRSPLETISTPNTSNTPPASRFQTPPRSSKPPLTPADTPRRFGAGVGKTRRHGHKHTPAPDGDEEDDADFRISGVVVVEQPRRSLRKRKPICMALPPPELEFEESSEDGERDIGGDEDGLEVDSTDSGRESEKECEKDEMEHNEKAGKKDSEEQEKLDRSQEAKEAAMDVKNTEVPEPEPSRKRRRAGPKAPKKKPSGRKKRKVTAPGPLVEDLSSLVLTICKFCGEKLRPSSQDIRAHVAKCQAASALAPYSDVSKLDEFDKLDTPVKLHHQSEEVNLAVSSVDVKVEIKEEIKQEPLISMLSFR
ncbi:hypothetical protein BJ508DRAFT_325298 [Ascobolus immersus RN42]|uniref:Uncharacterized protein n=1 Tax=Ascobolus immersus RN42 TaxID=1160509 RepID=A0A3N4I905_ASCIM|nr:hypothetical protein BJ508DRAFT_325298 [Ascobolus immersus RN42]